MVYRGIGERLALAFAAQKCKLCLAARNLDELGAVADRCIAAGAADAIAIQCDVSDPEQLAAMAEKCVGQLGNVQVSLPCIMLRADPAEGSQISGGAVLAADTDQQCWS